MANVRRGRAEWMKLVKQWRGGGEDAIVFATRHGVKVSTLRWWASELKKDRRAVPALREVVVDRTPAKSIRTVSIILGSLEMRVEVGADPDYVASVAAALVRAGRS